MCCFFVVHVWGPLLVRRRHCRSRCCPVTFLGVTASSRRPHPLLYSLPETLPTVNGCVLFSKQVKPPPGRPESTPYLVVMLLLLLLLLLLEMVVHKLLLLMSRQIQRYQGIVKDGWPDQVVQGCWSHIVENIRMVQCGQLREHWLKMGEFRRFSTLESSKREEEGGKENSGWVFIVLQ